jgi:T5SS/PEP-CTERM-associated repeat protein
MSLHRDFSKKGLDSCQHRGFARIGGQVVAALVVLLGVAFNASAVPRIWDVTSGDWNEPLNWLGSNPRQPPGAGDTAEINNGGTAHIFDPAVAAFLWLGRFNNTSGNLQITLGGNLQTQGAIIGSGTSEVESSVFMNAGTWTNNSFLTIGNTGDARIDILNGSTLTIDTGTGINNNAASILGQQEGTTGTVVVNSSLWRTQGNNLGIWVGRSGTGLLYVLNGGRVATGYLYLGYDDATSTGNEVIVSGSNSRIDASADIWVGRVGKGKAQVLNGGTVAGRTTNVLPGSSVLIDAATWTGTSGFYMTGHMGVSSNVDVINASTLATDVVSVSSANLNVENSTILAKATLAGAYGFTVSGTSGYVLLDSQSKLVVSSDTANVPADARIYVGNRTGRGILEVRSGGTLEANTDAEIDGLDGTRAIVTGAVSSWFAEDLTVGNVASGELFITTGGTVRLLDNNDEYHHAVIARSSGSTGAVTVSGTDGQNPTYPSQLAVRTLTIGDAGIGRLTVNGGGLVSSLAGIIGALPSPDSTFEPSSARIEGVGSKWETSRLTVGDRNKGSLTVRSGGTMQVGEPMVAGAATIGANNNATFPASATVDGADSLLKVYGDLTVGEYGYGTLEIKNGGHVDSVGGWIGYANGSYGAVTVNNATWLNRDTLVVGLGGDAVLDIRPGGLVAAKDGVVIGPGGKIMGTGAISGEGVTLLVHSEGCIAPGSSPGTLTINGSYSQASNGVLQIELASPTSYDVLAVSGQAMLGGTLEVNLLNGYTPAPTDTFNFLTASSFTGSFSNVVVNSASGQGGNFDIDVTPSGLRLSNFDPGPGDDGPIAHWDAENGAADATGNGHDGTFQGDASTVTDGPFGKAFTFDGNGDYINIGDELDMGTSDFTLSAWIKGDPSMHQWARIFDKGYASAYSLHRRAFTNEIGFEMLNSGNFFATDSLLIDNTWHHVALVKDGTTVTIYADGEAENSNSVSGAAQENSLPLLIGFNPGEGIQGFWKGLLDELKIFDRALSPGEIATLAAIPDVLPGDFNRDGTVDSADYVVWRKGLGTTYTANDFNTWRSNFGNTTAADLPGDFNDDGKVDSADYVVWRKIGGTQAQFNTWRANFGRSSGSGSLSANVPEPTSLTLYLVLLGALAIQHQRRPRCR